MNSDCPTTTSDHHNHDFNWMVIDDSGRSTVCVACITTICSDASQVNVKKRHFVNLLLDIVRGTRGDIVNKLRANVPAASHLIDVLLDLIPVEDKCLSNLACEGILLIVTAVKQKIVTDLVINRILRWLQGPCNFQESLPVFQLTGNLLSKIPSLVSTFMNKCVLENIVTGLTYPNEVVKQTTLYLLVQLGKEMRWQLLDGSFKSQLVKEILQLFKGERAPNLLLNGVALLRHMIEDELVLHELFTENAEGATFPMALKKMLLCRQTSLQIACSQCLSLALTQRTFDASKANLIMENDVLEILFEVLVTSNPVLIESILCCILQFTEYSNFFMKCHSVYGIEPILRSVDQLNQTNHYPILSLGFVLLQQIFSKHPSGVTLLSSSRAVQQTISVLLPGINSSHRKISLEATRAVRYFLRKDFLHSTIPFQDVQKIIVDCSKDVDELFRCQWKAAVRKRSRNFSQALVALKFIEDLTIAKLNVIHQAIRLIRDCLHDPISHEETFKAPQDKPEISVMEELALTIINILDEIYIPTILDNIDVLTSTKAHETMVECLTDLNDILPETMCDFYVYLAKTGFLEWLWDLKNNFTHVHNLADLKCASNKLLQSMLSSLSWNCEEKEIFESHANTVFDPGYFDGKLEECIFILLESTEESSVITDAHATVLTTLYFHKLFSGRNVASCDIMLEILAVFIQNIPEMKPLPIDAFKHLLFLFAVSCEEIKLTELQQSKFLAPSLVILTQTIPSYSNYEALYTHHKALIGWVFNFPTIANHLGTIMISQWIRICLPMELDADVTEDLNALRIILCRSSLCMSALLDLVTRDDATVTAPQIWSVLEGLLIQFDTYDVQMESYPILIDKFCEFSTLINAQTSVETIEETLAVMLKIICQIKTQEEKDSDYCTVVDLKLMQIVCCILLRSNSKNLAMCCYHFLNVLLCQTAQFNDSRVLGIILSNYDLLKSMLQCSIQCENENHSVALTTLANLAHYQCKYKIQVGPNLNLEFNTLRMMLASKHAETVDAAIYLFTVLLETSFKCPLITLTSSTASDLALISSALTPLYVCLQNLAVENDQLMQEFVFQNIRRTLVYIRQKDLQLGNLVLQQPWMGMMFVAKTKYILQNQCPEMMALLHMFLQSGVKNNAVSRIVTHLLHQLVAEKNSSLVAAEKSFLTMLTEKIFRGVYESEIDPNLKKQVHTKLQGLTETSKQPP